MVLHEVWFIKFQLNRFLFLRLNLNKYPDINYGGYHLQEYINHRKIKKQVHDIH